MRHPAAKGWGNSGHFLPYLPQTPPLHSTLRHPAAKGWGNSGHFLPYLPQTPPLHSTLRHPAAKGWGNSGHFLPYLPQTPPLHSTLRHPAAKGRGNSGRILPYLLWSRGTSGGTSRDRDRAEQWHAPEPEPESESEPGQDKGRSRDRSQSRKRGRDRAGIMAATGQEQEPTRRCGQSGWERRASMVDRATTQRHATPYPSQDSAGKTGKRVGRKRAAQSARRASTHLRTPRVQYGTATPKVFFIKVLSRTE